MTYTAYETNGPYRYKLGEAATREEAVALVTAKGNVICLDLDDENDAADIALGIGAALVLFAVEPTA